MAAKPLIGRKNSLRPCVKHFSHSHPLRPVDVKEEEEIICSGCELDLSGSAYKCTKSTCDFFLHKSCFELPRELEHTSHPQHLLVLLSSPPGDDSKFTCNACGDYGTSFAYHCATCQFNLHVGCAFLPKTMKHVDHNHPLTLLYSTNFLDKEGLVFTCDVCRKEVSQTSWVYYCLDCDYGTDLHCTTPAECSREANRYDFHDECIYTLLILRDLHASPYLEQRISYVPSVPQPMLTIAM